MSLSGVTLSNILSSVTLWCHSLVSLSLVSLSGVTPWCHSLVSLSFVTLLCHSPVPSLVSNELILFKRLKVTLGVGLSKNLKICTPSLEELLSEQEQI